jgi:hypothetical protein
MYSFLKLARLTHATVNDLEKHVQIPSGKGCGRYNFCAGSSLQESFTSSRISKHSEFSFNIYDEVDHVSMPKTQLKPEVQLSHESKKQNWLKLVLFFICGIENSTATTTKVAENIPVEADAQPTQSLLSSTICNLNAILLLSVTGFIYAFFNNYN